MSVFFDIISEIKSTLSQNFNQPDVKFIDADRNEKVPNPMKNIYVSLGLGKINIDSGAFGSYLGANSVGEQYGNHAMVDVDFKIFSPREKCGSYCYEIFSKIFECLLLHQKNINIRNFNCGKIAYNSDIFSFELVCTLNLELYLGYENEDIDISDIHVEKLS